MRYFNYIFISGYRAYLGYNTSPKFVSVILVVTCIIPMFGLFLNFLQRVFHSSWLIDIITPHPLSTVVVFAAIVVLLYSYYTDTRIADLMNRFDEKSKWERMFWGAIAVLSFVVPWVLFAVTIK